METDSCRMTPPVAPKSPRPSFICSSPLPPYWRLNMVLERKILFQSRPRCDSAVINVPFGFLSSQRHRGARWISCLVGDQVQSGFHLELSCAYDVMIRTSVAGPRYPSQEQNKTIKDETSQGTLMLKPSLCMNLVCSTGDLKNNSSTLIESWLVFLFLYFFPFREPVIWNQFAWFPCTLHIRINLNSHQNPFPKSFSLWGCISCGAFGFKRY